MLDQYIPKEELIEMSLISVLNVSVFITVALVIMSLLLRKGRLVKVVGPSCIIYLLMALIIRMFIPIEFNFDLEIPVRDILSPFFRMFFYEIRIEGLFCIKLYQLLFFIWIFGAAISMCFKLVSYRKIRRYTSYLPVADTNDIKERLNNIDISHLLDTVKVAYSKEINSPYLIGFFKPLIVLPMIEYSDDELRYVVAHELMHAKNKDIFWKILVDFLCTVFWWNPIFNFLRDQLFKMIEIRNDREIIKDFEDHEVLGYLECLMNTAIHLSGKDVLFSVSFSRSDFEELQLRMGLVSENRRYSRGAQSVLTMIVVAVVLFTTLFAISPVAYPDESITDGGVPLTGENTFLVESNSGYDVYVYGEYLVSTNDLRPFWGVPIYESLEEASVD